MNILHDKIKFDFTYYIITNNIVAIMSNVDFRNTFNSILNDIVIITTSKYKNIIKDIIKYFNNSCCDGFYYLHDYNFNDILVFDISITKLNKSNALSIACKISNPTILGNDCDEESYLLQILITSIQKNSSIYTLIDSALESIENIRNKYVYSKYDDMLIEKTKLHKQNIISKEVDMLCRKQVATCLVCMDDVSHLLYSSCCKQNICRLCINQIEPKKCPNCREVFYI
jgi:hypothetical protein